MRAGLGKVTLTWGGGTAIDIRLLLGQRERGHSDPRLCQCGSVSSSISRGCPAAWGKGGRVMEQRVEGT